MDGSLLSRETISDLSTVKAPPDDHREPTLDPARADSSARAFVRLIRRGIAVLIERREPHLDPSRTVADEGSLFGHATLSVTPRRRWVLVGFVLISLLIHAAFVIGARFSLFGGGGGGDGSMPVRLVLEQPQEKTPPVPKPEPEQQQQKQQQKPPVHGMLASDELGDPKATGDKPAATRAPAAGETRQQPGEAPPPPSSATSTWTQDAPSRPMPQQDQQHSAAPAEKNQPATPEQIAAAGAVAPPPVPDAPDSDIAVKRMQKPSAVRMAAALPGGARRPTDRPDDPSHGEGHKAKYPGPDATRDEYLAYIRDLTQAQLVGLPPGPFAGRSGAAVFQVVVRPSGAITWVSLVQSSGHPDADRLLADALNGLKQFPPLPQELQEANDAPARLTYSQPLSAVPVQGNESQ